jgi:putative oxidoreductase
MEMETALLVIGRLLLASLFVYAGIKHCFVAKDIIPMIAARGIPYPKLVLAIGSVFEFVFGVMLAFGIAGPWAPLGLAAFTIAATLMLVNFWDMQGAPREHALVCFQYNIAIIGGLLIAAAAGY